MFHDVGKVAVPDQIPNKSGRLTEEERRIVERHPIVGHDILKPLRTFQSVLPIIRWHHERPSGKGYPDGLKGEALPLLPRIVAVADCFDALTTDRPYRPAMSLPECRDILQRSSDAGDLDARAVKVFLQIVGDRGDIFTGAFA